MPAPLCCSQQRRCRHNRRSLFPPPPLILTVTQQLHNLRLRTCRCSMQLSWLPHAAACLTRRSSTCSKAMAWHGSSSGGGARQRSRRQPLAQRQLQRGCAWAAALRLIRQRPRHTVLPRRSPCCRHAAAAAIQRGTRHGMPQSSRLCYAAAACPCCSGRQLRQRRLNRRRRASPGCCCAPAPAAATASAPAAGSRQNWLRCRCGRRVLRQGRQGDVGVLADAAARHRVPVQPLRQRRSLLPSQQSR